MLAQSRHQQMFVNVTPSKFGRFISSKLLASNFHFLHGSLSSCAILYNIPHSQIYTMAQMLYKRGLNLYIGLEMLVSAFSFSSAHFHNSCGYTHFTIIFASLGSCWEADESLSLASLLKFTCSIDALSNAWP